MKYSGSHFVALLVMGAVSVVDTFAAPALTGFPFTDESLTYSVNWPSGLSLGEGHLRSKHAGANWSFELGIEAGVPGFAVKDAYQALAGADFCSISFDRTTAHGSRHTAEKEAVDRAKSSATRTTANGGGTTELRVPDCVKDALTFLFFTRRELGQGRVPPAQQMLLGGLYPIRLEYAGAQTVTVGEKPEQSDKLVCTVQGAHGETRFEMYFARDAARTPLLIKAPFAMGTFSMELVR
jgi:hypothetical protein